MGNCCLGSNRKQRYGPASAGAMGGGGGAPAAQPPTSAKDKQRHRESMWMSTGIIGLRDQRLSTIPGSVASAGPQAKVLDCANNQIRDLGPVSQLPNLSRLVAVHNQIATLPGGLISCLRQLKQLALDENTLTSLPAEIGQLTSLEKMSVSNNHLSALPDTLVGCTKLNTIHASHNKMCRLPEVLPDALVELLASHNSITDIPTSFGRASKLTTLLLDSNQISDVPEEVLRDCGALQTLSLHSNPITPARLHANPAFEVFEERRRSKYDKAIAGGVLMGAKGLDEGIDRKQAAATALQMQPLSRRR